MNILLDVSWFQTQEDFDEDNACGWILEKLLKCYNFYDPILFFKLSFSALQK